MGIRKLPENLINQIAAGEVIEKPSFVIKELIENSIDANSSEIEININNAGKSEILISDDGDGISKNDLKKSVERHATSKLSDDDLFNLNFLGFRGEALPSIASVSELIIESNKKNQNESWGIKCIQSHIKDFFPSSRNKGTKVRVLNLFSSVPARLKFLKSNIGENSHSLQIIRRLSIINFHIGFKVRIDNKEVLYLVKENKSKEGFKNRLKNLFGHDFLQNTIEISSKKLFYNDQITLTGVIGFPTLNFANQTKQFIFVNGRAVQDRGISSVIRLSYKDTLPRGRFPVYCLFINVPNHFVDVNVHPTKMEVRFKDYKFVKSFIISSISSTLNDETKKSVSRFSNFYEEEFTSFNQHLNKKNTFGHQNIFAELNLEPMVKKNTGLENNVNNISGKENDFPLGYALYQFQKNYIISISSNGIILIDQHAAHERIVFEKYKSSIQNETIQKEFLLLPVVVDLQLEQFNVILKNTKLLRRLGFSIEEFGETSILVREIPSLLKKYDIKNVVIDLIDDILISGLPIDYHEKMNLIMGNVCCHRSVRSGRSLTIEEMNGLLREMEKTPNYGQCNHGRPTYISFSLNQLEKLFQRQ